MNFVSAHSEIRFAVLDIFCNFGGGNFSVEGMFPSNFFTANYRSTLYMHPFVHLHVHSQYSLLDGQAAVTGLVDKAMADGMPGIALTDHGNMFGIKELFNYLKKLGGKNGDKLKEAREKLASASPEERPAIEAEIEKLERKLAFKPIFGCEMYVAQKSLHEQARHGPSPDCACKES